MFPDKQSFAATVIAGYAAYIPVSFEIRASLVPYVLIKGGHCYVMAPKHS